MTSASHPDAHILVVDDDPDIRDTLVEILEDQGYSVASAADGLRAFEYLDSGNRTPDLILLDLMMPNMNGFQFRERQLATGVHAGIPVAVFTADGNAKNKAAQLHAAGYVQKPVTLSTLHDVIIRILEARHVSA